VRIAQTRQTNGFVKAHSAPATLQPLLCSASVCQPAPLGTVDEVASVLTKAGVNAAAIKAAFDAAETETALDKACAEAAERGVFGSPTFFVGTRDVLRQRPIGFPQRSVGEGSMRPLAIITGVRPGTGSALVRRFHEGGYQVAMLARWFPTLRSTP
jgi:hypothetical protein